MSAALARGAVAPSAARPAAPQGPAFIVYAGLHVRLHVHVSPAAEAGKGQ